MIWSRFDRSNCSEKLPDKYLLCLCLSRFFLKGNYAQVERYWSTTMRTFLIKNFTVSLGDNHENYVDSNLLYKNQLILPSYTYRWGRLNPKENHHSSLSLSSVLSPIGRVLLRLHLLKGDHKFLLAFALISITDVVKKGELALRLSSNTLLQTDIIYRVSFLEHCIFTNWLIGRG